MPKYYWKIDDGRIWSSADNGFVGSVPEGETVIPLMDNGAPAGIDHLMATIEFYGLGPAGGRWDAGAGRWVKERFSKKEFLLRCGLPKVAALNAAAAQNPLLKAVHDILMASEYIDVTDPATQQLVGLLTTAEGGNIFTPTEAAAILAGE